MENNIQQALNAINDYRGQIQNRLQYTEDRNDTNYNIKVTGDENTQVLTEIHAFTTQKPHIKEEKIRHYYIKNQELVGIIDPNFRSKKDEPLSRYSKNVVQSKKTHFQKEIQGKRELKIAARNFYNTYVLGQKGSLKDVYENYFAIVEKNNYVALEEEEEEQEEEEEEEEERERRDRERRERERERKNLLNNYAIMILINIRLNFLMRVIETIKNNSGQSSSQPQQSQQQSAMSATSISNRRLDEMPQQSSPPPPVTTEIQPSTSSSSSPSGNTSGNQSVTSHTQTPPASNFFNFFGDSDGILNPESNWFNPDGTPVNNPVTGDVTVVANEDEDGNNVVADGAVVANGAGDVDVVADGAENNGNGGEPEATSRYSRFRNFFSRDKKTQQNQEIIDKNNTDNAPGAGEDVNNGDGDPSASLLAGKKKSGFFTRLGEGTRKLWRVDQLDNVNQHQGTQGFNPMAPKGGKKTRKRRKPRKTRRKKQKKSKRKTKAKK